ncbi:MAG: type I-E CRISPR-associated endonuclease Cas1e [Eubacteriales bacterium]|nr:type I-E CRISPR-associated endonuclease Cas1e [Eubacteriales bacterium]
MSYKVELHELPQIKSRLTFLYVERSKIHRQDGAVTIRDDEGMAFVPAAMLSVLILGPGTNISHRAIELIAEVGASVLWLGEQGVRFYAGGKPMSHSSRLLERQAKLVSNSRSRLSVARQMYQMRFPDEDVSKLTMQQLRGKEGARVRRIYRENSERTGVPWDKREYDSQNFEDGNAINQALSAAHACLYGVCYAAIEALGCSPGLGFVHTGNIRSFVYDMADLYKAEITIPVAFDVAAEEVEDIGSVVRRRVRDVFHEVKILPRITKDILTLLQLDEEKESEREISELFLWDKDSILPTGVQYNTYSTEAVWLEEEY